MTDKLYCKCGLMQKLVADGHLARREEDQSIFLPTAHGWFMPIRYCFFCGGALESQGDSRFTAIDDDEVAQAMNDFVGIRTVEDLINTFGPPDETVDATGMTFRSGELKFKRQLTYRRRWRNTAMYVHELTDGTLRPFFSGKLIERTS